MYSYDIYALRLGYEPERTLQNHTLIKDCLKNLIYRTYRQVFRSSNQDIRVMKIRLKE